MRLSQCRPPDSRRRREGAIALEMLLVLPVFLVLLLGFVELSTIVMVEERLAAASAQGARVASQGGATSDVTTAIENYFGPGKITDNYTLNITQNVTDPPSLIVSQVNPITISSGSPIRVIVKIEASKVVPDLLRIIGFGLSGQILVGQTVMRKE
jgi:hypothetical protein